MCLLRRDRHQQHERHRAGRAPRRAPARTPRARGPTTTVNADAMPRWVTGMPASAGAAIARADAGNHLERHAGGARARALPRRRGRTRTGRRPSAGRRAVRGARRGSSARGSSPAACSGVRRACRRRSAARGAPARRVSGLTSASKSTRSARRSRASAARVSEARIAGAGADQRYESERAVCGHGYSPFNASTSCGRRSSIGTPSAFQFVAQIARGTRSSDRDPRAAARRCLRAARRRAPARRRSWRWRSSRRRGGSTPPR